MPCGRSLHWSPAAAAPRVAAGARLLLAPGMSYRAGPAPPRAPSQEEGLFVLALHLHRRRFIPCDGDHLAAMRRPRAAAALILVACARGDSAVSLSAAAAAAAAPSSSGSICGAVYGPPPASAPLPGVLLYLDGGAQRAQSRAGDGGFCFRRLPPGVHLVEAAADARRVPALLFPAFKVALPDAAAAQAGEEPRALEYRHPGAHRLPAPLPLAVRPVAAAPLHEARPAASALAFLLNPQILLMLALGAMTLCLPMLTKVRARTAAPARQRSRRCAAPPRRRRPPRAARAQNMDPEALKEMQEQQAAMGDPSQMLRGLLGGAAPAPAPAPARAAISAAAAAVPAAAAGGGAAAAAAAVRRGARDK